MANWHMKRCSTSLIIEAMPIKTTAKYHLTPVRTAITRKATNGSYGGGGERGALAQG